MVPHSLPTNHACAAASLFGLALSLYTLYVEHNLDSDSNYKPVCDLAYYVSCSRTFRSPFANGFGVTSPILGANHVLTQKNPIYGCLSYTFVFLLQFIHCSWAKRLSQILSVFMNLLSIYLLFILVYLRTICIICVCIYVINASLLYFSFQKHPFLSYSSISHQKRS